MGRESMTTLELAQRLDRMRAAGAIQGVSARVLYAMMADEYWLKIVAELEAQEDWKTITEVLKFHQQMHEGRPAQKITVTSIGVQFSAAEVSNARDVVRELVNSSARQRDSLALTEGTPPIPNGAMAAKAGEVTIAGEGIDGEHASGEARG